MTPERWHQIKSLFEEALTYDPTERYAFLEEVCAGDEALHQEVNSLLTSYLQSSSFIEIPAFKAADKLIQQFYTLSPGSMLQTRYVIVRSIAQGGMGAVYEAFDQRLKSEVALKQCSFSDERLRKAFEREAHLLANLRHPALPKVTDHFTENNSQFLIMEFIPGKDLAELIMDNGTPFPVEQVLEWFDKLLDALIYLHNHNPLILHRDIKPNNLKLNAEGQIILLDFGLAKGSSSPKSRATSTGSIFGYTPDYAPLEQIHGLGSDTRSDLYSLAATIYHLITGVIPAGAGLRANESLAKRNDPLLFPNSLNPSIPVGVAQLLLDAMELNRDLRPSGAEEMRNRLHQAIDRRRKSKKSPEDYITHAETVIYTKEEKKSVTMEVDPGLLPFIAGPPISHPRNFFGREREIKRIFGLLKQRPLQNAAIVGPQRSGKTSLLHYLKKITKIPSTTLRSGQRQDWLNQPESYNWIFVDFQDSRMGTRKGLLGYLLARFNQKVPDNLDMDHFLDTASECLQNPTVILMDEISVALQRYKELDNSFWEGLRSLATNLVNGNLAFILSASDLPYHLAGQSGLGSPFFNIFGYTATIGPLPEVEARELLANSPIPFSEHDITWILSKSGRWPILVQILARERLIALESDEQDEDWQDEAIRQMAPYIHLLG